MTTDRTARPLPGCPARAGQGTDVRAASFTFVVEDHPAGRHPAVTEIFGFYQIPGQDPDDLVQAAGFEVPAGSPIARLARQVAASPRRTRVLAAVLRANILSCPCVPADGECPALDEIRLLRAIEHAAGATRRRDAAALARALRMLAARTTRPGGRR